MFRAPSLGLFIGVFVVGSLCINESVSLIPCYIDNCSYRFVLPKLGRASEICKKEIELVCLLKVSGWVAVVPSLRLCRRCLPKVTPHFLPSGKKRQSLFQILGASNVSCDISGCSLASGTRRDLAGCLEGLLPPSMFPTSSLLSRCGGFVFW